MPYEISQTGDRNVSIKFRADDINPQAATAILTGLKAEVEGRKGVLKLVHTTDPKRNMVFELKSRHQFIELRSSKMENTSVYLRGLFRRALEGCNEQIKAEFLSHLDRYLQANDNEFDSRDLVTFVNRLEDLQSQPRAVEEPYTWADPDVKRLTLEDEIEPWNKSNGDLKAGKWLVQGVSGEVCNAKVPLTDAGQPFPRHLDRVVKQEHQLQYFAVSTPSNGPDSEFPLMRQNDFAASRFKSRKGLIRPEYYYVKVKSDVDDEAPISYRVSAQTMKGFVRDLAQENPDAHIALYATIMPRAKGEEVGKMLENGPLDVQGAVRDIAAGAYKALNKLHQHGFAHNDIKPENMFHDKDSLEVTLIDTGSMQKHSKGGKPDYVQSRQTAGTPGYAAPQVLQGIKRGPETDYYSFACTLLVAAEPKMEDVLKWIRSREADKTGKMSYDEFAKAFRPEGIKGEEIIANHGPKDYLQIIIDEAKSSKDSTFITAGEALEQKLGDNPEFERAVINSFIASSGKEPAATEARRLLALNPYLNPFPQAQDKPYELPTGKKDIDIKKRTSEVDSEDAMKILTVCAPKWQEKRAC